MSVNHFMVVSLRVLGIYCFIESIWCTQGMVYVFTMPHESQGQFSQMVGASLFPSVALFLLAVVLITFAPKLANLLAPHSESSDAANNWTLEGFQAALFSATGLLIFSSAIPPAFQWISQLVRLSSQDQYGVSYTGELIRGTWISITLTAIQLVLGIVLFFGGRIVSRFLIRLRTATPSNEPSERA